MSTPENQAAPILDPDHLARLIDENEAAEFLRVSARTLQKRRVHGGGPPFVRVSTRWLRYRRRDLIAWSEERIRRHTTEIAPVRPLKR